MCVAKIRMLIRDVCSFDFGMCMAPIFLVRLSMSVSVRAFLWTYHRITISISNTVTIKYNFHYHHLKKLLCEFLGFDVWCTGDGCCSPKKKSLQKINPQPPRSPHGVHIFPRRGSPQNIVFGKGQSFSDGVVEGKKSSPETIDFP